MGCWSLDAECTLKALWSGLVLSLVRLSGHRRHALEGHSGTPAPSPCLLSPAGYEESGLTLPHNPAMLSCLTIGPKQESQVTIN